MNNKPGKGVKKTVEPIRKLKDVRAIKHYSTYNIRLLKLRIYFEEELMLKINQGLL